MIIMVNKKIRKITRYIKQNDSTKNIDIAEENLCLYYYFPEYFRKIGKLEFFYYEDLIPRGIWKHLKLINIDFLHQLNGKKISDLLKVRTFGPKYIIPLLKLCKEFNINKINDIKKEK